MIVHTIPPANWHVHLVEAIKQSQGGDTIVVQSDSAVELANRAIARMRPDLKVTVETRDSALLIEPVKRGGIGWK